MKTVVFAFMLFLLGASAVVPVMAEVGEGWRYTYVYSFSVDGNAVSGTASSEVVRVLEDGRLRLRFESTFNDGIATLEKNMPAQAFNPPRIPGSDITSSFSYSKNDVSYAFTVTEVDRSERTVGGRSYQSVIYSLVWEYRDANRTVSGEARLEVFAGSGVIYSFEGNVRSRMGAATFSIRLVDANIDLNSPPAPQASSTGYMPSTFLTSLPIPEQASVFLINSPLNTPTPSTGGTTSADDAGIRAVIAGVVGLGALAAVAAVGVKRRRVEASGVVKPHYV